MTTMTAAAAQALGDDEVVRRILDGERGLFELLMRRHNRRVFRTVRSIVRNDADAEDVMQQAYINAFTHLHQFQFLARFSTWLTRIAIREAMARVGRPHLHAVDSIDEAPEESAMPQPNPETQASHRELVAVLEAEVDALPDAYRTVFMLRVVEDMPVSETAACLGVSEEVVKVRLHRARQMLKDAFERRVGAEAQRMFSFDGGRCDRVVEQVMRQVHGS